MALDYMFRNDYMFRSIYAVDTYMLLCFGQDFTSSENSDSPRFPIFHNFKSKREIVMSLWSADQLFLKEAKG